jgi:hypothetical protein
MDSQVESIPGQMLDSLGPVTLSVRDLLQSEQHTSTLVANTFWQSYVHSSSFWRDLERIGVSPSRVMQHEIMVVAHGLYRYSLLLTDPSLTSEDVRPLQVRPRLEDVREGWNKTAYRHLAEESRAKLTDLWSVPFLAPAPALAEVLTQPFALVVTGVIEEVLTSVPVPHIPVIAGGGTSTAGCRVQDSVLRIGVTAAEHAVPVGSAVTVGQLPGNVISRDPLTDSCFIHVPGIENLGSQPSHGPLRLAPRQNDLVTFSGVATPAGSTRIVAWNFELPYIDPHLQQTVRTDQVTSQMDSGAALLDGSAYIVGFAHSRSSPSAPQAYSSWIWADAVLKKHSLTIY